MHIVQPGRKWPRLPSYSYPLTLTSARFDNHRLCNYASSLLIKAQWRKGNGRDCPLFYRTDSDRAAQLYNVLVVSACTGQGKVETISSLEDTKPHQKVHLVHQVHYPILYIRWVYLAWAIGEGTQVARCPLCYLSTPDSIYTIRDVGQISGRD